jgi:acetolactate synthase I/II/III large subunit
MTEPTGYPISRRTLLKGMVASGIVPLLSSVPAVAAQKPGKVEVVKGPMNGAAALVEALAQEGTDVVFGIPGAQENELWDAMKTRGLPYMLCTHEFSAACMADGAARATGKPGVICVVPGPGVTNSLSGLGEALLDSVPIVCIVGDVSKGDKAKPFQVHALSQVDLLKPVTKEVIEVARAEDIPNAVHQAFFSALCGEPGPTAVIVPWNLLIEPCKFNYLGPERPALPFDEHAYQAALALLNNRKLCWGIYAGQGCMDASHALVEVAEILQAPVATSVSGKGVIPDNHPLAVGYGYGPYGTRTAEEIFKGVDGVLAIGVKYSEVSTAFYAIPKHKHEIQVDINPHNIGQIIHPEVCVNADAGLFLNRLIADQAMICRPHDKGLAARIARIRSADANLDAEIVTKKYVDPMAFVHSLRHAVCVDGMVFVDVTLTEHLMAESFNVFQPRTYFNPTDNQSMGWSIPAALGAQRVMPGRQTVAVVGDGCFLMSAMEITTAAREHLPVKFFVLDDQAYGYMQKLQKSAYLQTTATILARMDYEALAKGFGVAYQEICRNDQLDGGIRNALNYPGPMLTRVAIDYGDRKIRWIDAAKGRFIGELTPQQRAQFLARIGSRAAHHQKQND